MKIKQTTQLLVAFSIRPLAIALILAPTFSANAYTLIDLGPNVAPKAISNTGVVVGASNTDQYPATAFSWSSGDGFSIINGGVSAEAVNDNRLIAGSTVDGAFIGNRDWSNYAAFGMNQLGEVAGYNVGKNPYQPRSLPYNPAIFNGTKWVVYDIAKLYSRGTRQGVYADRFILSAINDFGYTVGYKYRYGLAGTSAILIDTNRPVKDASDVVYLPTPAGGRAADINGNNIVIGTTGSSTRTVPVIYAQAFFYNYGMDNLLVLPVLEGGLRSNAYDINELNQVVGSSEASSGPHAFIWNETDGIVDLNSTITEPGWVLSSATAINDYGEITGTGLHNGLVHGYVLSNSSVPVPPPVQNEPPEAVAGANVYSGKAALMVIFDASASTDPDGTIVGYSWDFNDGSFSTAVNPSHEFINPGKYLVTLVVTDDQGLTSSTQVEITVRKKKGK